jgi:hypothetical protein
MPLAANPLLQERRRETEQILAGLKPLAEAGGVKAAHPNDRVGYFKIQLQRK